MTAKKFLVLPYISSPAHLDRLKDLCRNWEARNEFWPYDSVIESLKAPETNLWFAQEASNDRWLGAIFIRNTGDDVELLYIHTIPESRGQGIGRLMLRQVLEKLREDMVQSTPAKFFLEVRASNSAAQNLYRSLGFSESGRRKKYYKDGEDALIFETTI